MEDNKPFYYGEISRIIEDIKNKNAVELDNILFKELKSAIDNLKDENNKK